MNENFDNKEYDDYQIPITDYNESNSVVGGFNSDVITATGNLKPDNFWMVVMILIMMALGTGAVFWINNLYGEIKSCKERISELEKKLEEAPTKTLKELEETNRILQSIRGDIKTADEKVEESNKKLLETNDKLKNIEKGL